MNDHLDMPAESSWRGVGRFFWELLKAFLVAIIIIVPIRYFLVQPFFVRGASMEPTFNDGQYLIIDQLSYRFRQPARGEVVVFHYPNRPSQFFIKRVIGLPHETVRIEGGQVIIKNTRHPEGVILNETAYLPADLRTGGQLETELGDDDYFVLGDNRPASSDSRSWGLLKEKEIVGRVWVRAFPFDALTIFAAPQQGFLGL
ncbi:MAG: signal peptidase I [Candidatus Andersenbacteria bacterium]|nr:signal peptidase I [Candidatus Andersenbacteria bacterium]